MTRLATVVVKLFKIDPRYYGPITSCPCRWCGCDDPQNEGVPQVYKFTRAVCSTVSCFFDILSGSLRIDKWLLVAAGAMLHMWLVDWWPWSTSTFHSTLHSLPLECALAVSIQLGWTWSFSHKFFKLLIHQPQGGKELLFANLTRQKLWKCTRHGNLEPSTKQPTTRG